MSSRDNDRRGQGGGGGRGGNRNNYGNRQRSRSRSPRRSPPRRRNDNRQNGNDNGGDGMYRFGERAEDPKEFTFTATRRDDNRRDDYRDERRGGDRGRYARDRSPPRGPRADSYRPGGGAGGGRNWDRGDRDGRDGGNRDGRDGGNRGRNGAGGGRGGRDGNGSVNGFPTERWTFQAHERPLLRNRQSKTPELMEGMVTREMRMELDGGASGLHHDEAADEKVATAGEEVFIIDGKKSDVVVDGKEVPLIKAELVTEGDPEAIIQAEKTRIGIMGVLRAAKSQFAGAASSFNNQITSNQDFISFDFGDENDDEKDAERNQPEPKKFRRTEDGGKVVVDGDQEHRYAVPDGPTRAGQRPYNAVPPPPPLQPPPSFPNDAPPPPPPGTTSYAPLVGAPPPLGAPTATPTAGFSHKESFHKAMDAKTPPSATTQATSNRLSFGVQVAQSRPTVPKGFMLDDHDDDDSDGNSGVVEVDNTAAGKKRKFDDRNTQPKSTVSNNIKPEYFARPNVDATPWIRQEGRDHSKTENMGHWLHKEIVDFTEYLWPRPLEHTVRQHLIHRISKALMIRFPDVDIRCFGSYASGLFLPSSDLDLVLISKSFTATGVPSYGKSHSSLQRVAHTLKVTGIIKPGSLTVLARARVPIIKFVDYETNLNVDISFENMSGLRAIDTMKRWKHEHPALVFLTILLKQYLSMRNLSEVYEGGLGGFAVVCLVVGMLKLVPEFASGVVDPRANLGIVLMEFFDLYGNKLNTTEIGLDPAMGTFIKKPPPPSRNDRSFANYKPDLLHIRDPNDPENDICRSSYAIQTILKGFSNAFRELQAEMQRVSKLSFSERKGVSLLKMLVGGDYREMTARRNRLSMAYQRIVPIGFVAPTPAPVLFTEAVDKAPQATSETKATISKPAIVRTSTTITSQTTTTTTTQTTTKKNKNADPMDLFAIFDETPARIASQTNANKSRTPAGAKVPSIPGVKTPVGNGTQTGSKAQSSARIPNRQVSNNPTSPIVISPTTTTAKGSAKQTVAKGNGNPNQGKDKENAVVIDDDEPELFVKKEAEKKTEENPPATPARRTRAAAKAAAAAAAALGGA